MADLQDKSNLSGKVPLQREALPSLASRKPRPAPQDRRAAKPRFKSPVAEVKDARDDDRLPPPPKKRAKTAASPKPPRGRLNSIFWVLFSLLVMCMGALVGLTVGYINRELEQLPVIEFLEDYQPAMPSRVFAGEGEGEMIANFYSDNQNREMVTLAEMPPDLINAVVAIEDRRFFEHCGIDLYGLIRAVIYDIRTMSREQGASTITIQLAEDLINNGHVDWPDMPETGLKDFQRKFWEWKVALQMEKRYTKDEILEIYLNQVFLGGQVYGVARAAEYYFGKELPELDLKECALFAGMLQAPNRFSPITYPERAQERTGIVLRSMLREGYITEDQYRAALDEPFKLRQKNERRTQIALYPYYSWAIYSEFSKNEFVTKTSQPIRINGKGIDVYSTIDVRLQEIAQSALRKGIEEHERRYRKHPRYWGTNGYVSDAPKELQVGPAVYDAKIVSEFDAENRTIQVTVPNTRGGEGPFTVAIDTAAVKWDDFDILHPGYYLPVRAVKQGDKIALRLAHDDHVQGAVVLVQPSTGRVLALAGGYDFDDKNNKGNFIRALQATTAQPGSAFKPLLMTAALSYPKRWTPASILKDIRYEYWRGWIPRNYYDEYFGDVTMHYTLVHSLNAASVWLLDNFKSSRLNSIQSLHEFCKNVFDLDLDNPNLSIALGTSGTSPMELAQAYSVIANRGDFVKLHLVDRVFQRHDSRRGQPNLLWEFSQPYAERKRLSPEVAYLTTYLLHDVVMEGTATDAKDLPFWCAGKTGTTDDCVKAWFTGFSNDILCVTYLGFDDHKRSLGVKMTGSQAALPIWIDVMKQTYAIHPEFFGEIQPPQSLVFRDICDKSGLLARDACRKGVDSYKNLLVHRMPFIEGSAPTTLCNVPSHMPSGLDARIYPNQAQQLILNANSQN